MGFRKALTSLALAVSLIVGFAHQLSAQTVGASCANANWIAFGDTANPNFIDYCNGSTWALAAAISSSGYLGINTANPSSPLDIEAIDPLITVHNTNDTVGAYIGDTWGKVQIGLKNFNYSSPVSGIPAGALYTFFMVEGTGKVGSTSGYYGNLSFRNLLDDGSGNVGIGSTSPAASLDISQKTDALALPSGTTAQRPGTPLNGEIRFNSSTQGIEGYFSGAWNALGGGGGGTLTLGTSSSATSPQRSGDATTGFFSPATGVIAEATGGSERFRIDSSGNVGIGTTSPAYPFVVYTSGYQALAVQASVNGVSINKAITGVIQAPTDLTVTTNNGSTTALYVSSGGYVGIGTTSPGYALDVAGHAAIGDTLYNHNNSSWISMGGTVAAGSGAVTLAPSGTVVFSALPNGSVGIGTSNPAATLHVVGEAIVGSTGLSCSSTTAGALQYASGFLQFCNGTAWQTINSATAGGATPGCGSSGTLSTQMQTTLNVASGCHVLLKVWGAAGGSGGFNCAGGGGGYTTITLGPLSSATTYYLAVGGGGIAQGNGGFGGAGVTGYSGGEGDVSESYPGGGGGAASGVWTGGYGAAGTPVAIAAGGGGCGQNASSGSIAGGNGGPQNSSTVGANSSSGTYSGGGGAGYPTGGSGGAGQGNGFGGTNYVASGGGTASGSGATPGNAGDSNYPANAGAAGSGINGYPGAIYYQTF